jgi:signal transduction histidine kinase
MQKIDNTLFAMVVSTSIILLMSGLFIAIIFRNLKVKENHKKSIFESIYLTQEEERGRIAMDLHDDLGATLLSLKLNMEELKYINDTQALRKGLETSLNVLSVAIHTTKLTSQTLMPQTLKTYGLSSALNDLIKRYRNFLTIDLIIEIDERYSQIIEINIYRIISELLTNTIKHAKATKVSINIQKETNILRIFYADNGVGFEYHTLINVSTGLGINNIKNRIAFLKGNLRFFNNSGTNCIFTIPIN